MSNAITWFQDQVIQPICSDLQVPYAFTTESVGIGTGAPVVWLGDSEAVTRGNGFDVALSATGSAIADLGVS